MLANQIFLTDQFGSLHAFKADAEGNALLNLDASDITLDTDLDSLNGTTIATDSGVTGGGVQRVVHVTDVATSVQAAGVAAHDAAVSGNPILQGGEARTTNPTAVADGDVVRQMHDDVGRQVMTPMQVRDLVTTGYVALSNGTETDLLDGTSGVFHDLVEITLANTSSAAISIDLRTGTAGSVVRSFEVPANDTVNQQYSVPVPQAEADQAWTVDMADVSNTTVNITGTFITNV